MASCTVLYCLGGMTVIASTNATTRLFTPSAYYPRNASLEVIAPKMDSISLVIYILKQKIFGPDRDIQHDNDIMQNFFLSFLISSIHDIIQQCTSDLCFSSPISRHQAIVDIVD